MVLLYKKDKMRTRFIILIIFILTACSLRLIPIPDPTQIPLMTPSSMEIQPIQTPITRDTKVVIPILSTPSASGLNSLIDIAKEDLAQRLIISIDQINFIEITEAEWSDSSLDCPQPGMDYLQVITPGYRIVMEANGYQYEYHSNRDSYIVYCMNSVPLIPPKP